MTELAAYCSLAKPSSTSCDNCRQYAPWLASDMSARVSKVDCNHENKHVNRHRSDKPCARLHAAWSVSAKHQSCEIAEVAQMG